MITTTSYGSWANHVRDGGGTLTVHAYVEASLGNWPGIDVDAVANDFRDAINTALPDSVQLCGDEFYGPHYSDGFDGYPLRDGGLDIGAVIDSVDFWEIVAKHDNIDH